MRVTSTTPDTKHGKVFEKKVHDAFRMLYTTYPICWERVLDSHDAGNLVRQAACDFKMIANSGRVGRPWVVNIECKASKLYTSLADGGACRSMIMSSQQALMRIAMRSGVLGEYWFHSVERNEIEVWSAAPVLASWGLKNVKNRGIDATPEVVQMDDLDTWAEEYVNRLLKRTK